jgi:predicted RNA binding protein YcfA (HicA-like mRNA interferase family)
MPKLPSAEHILKVLRHHGFVFKSQKGSHVKYVKDGRTVIVPYPCKEIPIGTLQSICKQAGLEKADFD